MVIAGDSLISSGAGGVPYYGNPFPWTECTYLKKQMYSKNGYMADALGLCIMILPESSLIGDTIKIICKGLNGVQVAQNEGQQIVVNSKTMTTIGLLGFITSDDQYDSLTLICMIGGKASLWFAEATGKWKVT